MKWQKVKIKEWNGYRIQDDTAFSKAKKLYMHRYPTQKTTETLKKFGIKQIVYQNGDTIFL